MVKKNTTGRGSSTYDESSLAGVQGVFYCSLAVYELWENTSFTTAWLVLAGGGDGGSGGMCAPFFK